MKKYVSILLLFCMALTCCACGTGSVTQTAPPQPETSAEEQTAQSPADAEAAPPEAAAEEKEPASTESEGDKLSYDEISERLYEENLGAFAEAYEKANAVVDNNSLRFGLMAIAEAKMLEAAVILPINTLGGTAAISREAPYSRSSCLWSIDQYRYDSALVAENQPITAEDRAAMTEKYAELKGSGTYYAWAKRYLEEKGYQLTDHYGKGIGNWLRSWDCFNLSVSSDMYYLASMVDFLLHYDGEDSLQPMLAESYSVSEDGMTYTFKLRQVAKWYDYQGRVLADVTADDFVCGLQHFLDCRAGGEYAVGAEGAKIKNADAYLDGTITDFDEVGVHAPDPYTLVYTLDEPNPFFLTMIPTITFAPLNRAYYESQGGTFGQDFDSTVETYLYASDFEHLACCGAYLVSSYADGNAAVLRANPDYYNADQVAIQRIDLFFMDDTDVLQEYRAVKDGDAAEIRMISTAQVEAAKNDGWYEKYGYISPTDLTCYGLYMNLNRQSFENVSTPGVAVSPQTEEERGKTALFMANPHFRRAIFHALDRGTYYAQKVGDELRYEALSNSFIPGNFVFLTEETELDLNGTATVFPAGTYYGAILQAQLDADGFPVKVWDPKANEGLGLSSGFDGWYQPELAVQELETAAEELGLELTAENPVYLDFPTYTGSPAYANQGQVVKKSIEQSLQGRVIVNLIEMNNREDWYHAGLLTNAGYEANYNIYDVGGWAADWGDPQTYLCLLYRNSGGLVRFLGLY